jgi:hypothetical protein
MDGPTHGRDFLVKCGDRLRVMRPLAGDLWGILSIINLLRFRLMSRNVSAWFRRWCAEFEVRHLAWINRPANFKFEKHTRISLF